MKMINPDADALTNNESFFGYATACYVGSFDNRRAPPPDDNGAFLRYDLTPSSTHQ